MKKKILIFLCVLTLSLNSYAESIAQSPPPLPVLEKTTKSVNDTESFWSKILEFFSFNDAKKNGLQPTIIASSSNKASTDEEQTIKPTNITNQLASNNVISANSSKTETINKPELPKAPDITDLKLPDGFAPNEELPKKKDENPSTISTDTTSATTSANNVAVNNQELNKQPDPTTEPKADASQDIKDSSKSQDTKLSTKLQTDITSTAPSNDLNVKKSDESTAQSREPVLTKNININIDKTIPLPNKVTTDQVTTKTPKSMADSDAEKSKNIDNLNVKSYRQHLQEQLNKPKKLPEISREDLNPDHTVEMDSAQLKFVNDEAQMLLLPSDEVVMGEVTTESQLDLMDFGSYLKIFWDNYNNIKEEPARQSINNFINNYDNNFHKLPSYSQEELADILMEAFKAIDKNSIYDLMNLLDNYPILQLVDYKGNSLLHKSVYKNNYLAAKFLIMKGIDTSIRNNEGLRALDTAIIQRKTNIEILLKSAGAN